MALAEVRWEVANHRKRIIVHDTGGTYGVCGWDECDNYATSLHQVRMHEHVTGRRLWSGPEHGWISPRDICDAVDAGVLLGRHMWMAFCSDRHKNYWTYSTGAQAHEAAARNRGQIYGQLPEGMKRTIL